MQKSNAKEVLTVIDKTLSEQTPREKQKMDTPKVLSMFFFHLLQPDFTKITCFKVSSTGISSVAQNLNNGATGNRGKRGTKNSGRGLNNQGARGGKIGQNGRGFQRNNNSNNNQGERLKWEESAHINNGSSKIAEVCR